MSLALRVGGGAAGVRSLLRVGGGRGVKVTVGALILVAIVIAPLFAPQPALQTSGAVLNPPSAMHLLGTDRVGRDVFSRLLAGGRLITALSLGAGALSVLLGGAIGIVAGYLRGAVDGLLMRCVDVVLAMPAMLVILVVAAAMPRSNLALVLLAGVLSAPGAARIVRGITQQYAAREFVTAAEAAGDRWYWIAAAEILPNLQSRLLLELALRTGYAVILISSLNFLGLGVSPPTPDWGLMISDAQPVMTVAPVSAVAPAVALALLVGAVNLIADGLGEESGR